MARLRANNAVETGNGCHSEQSRDGKMSRFREFSPHRLATVATQKGRASADLINFRPSRLDRFKTRTYRKKWLLLIIRRRRPQSSEIHAQKVP
jgi:hypothetical protein